MDEYIVADLNALLSTVAPDALESEALEKFLNALAVKGYELAHVIPQVTTWDQQGQSGSNHAMLVMRRPRVTDA